MNMQADLEQRRHRIIAIASQLVEGMITKGEIECTDEAIKAAMPEAIATARAAYDAAAEYVRG